MTLPLRMLFGIIASQGGGAPPATPYHIQTLCYSGNGAANRRLEVPGVNLSYSGSGMFMIRCITNTGDTVAFIGKTRTEGYILSNADQHEQCAPHRISEMGDGYVILGNEPSWYNATGNTYSLIAFEGDFFNGGVHDGSELNYPHSLGSEPRTLWISENRNVDIESYNSRYGVTPEDFSIPLNLATAASPTGYWANTKPTTSQYSCTTTAFHAYFVFGNSPSKCLTSAYEGTGSPITVDLGFKPKFVIIKEYDSNDNWYWFSEAMEACDKYHLGTPHSSPQEDLVDFVSNGVHVKDSRLTKNVWYNIFAIG